MKFIKMFRVYDAYDPRPTRIEKYPRYINLDNIFCISPEEVQDAKNVFYVQFIDKSESLYKIDSKELASLLYKPKKRKVK